MTIVSPLNVASFQDSDFDINPIDTDARTNFSPVFRRSNIVSDGFAFSGTVENDTLAGNDEENIILGFAGNDLLSSGAGDDVISGGAGFDNIFAGVGDDTVDGGAQADNIFGGLGNDQLEGNLGNDRVFGEAGDDIISGGDGDDRLFGNAGFDTISGGNGNDFIEGQFNIDILSGGEGNDSLFGGTGDDSLDGDAGFDSLEGGDGDDSLSGGGQADNLFGDAGDDTLNGDQGNDRLFGGIGNDQLSGGAGVDALFGQVGNDSLNGNAGNDRLFGNAGFDTLDGGTGNDILFGGFNADTFSFSDNFGQDIIADFDQANLFERIDLTGVTGLNSFADVLANLSEDQNGNAVITDGSNSLTLQGVGAIELEAQDFIVRNNPRAVSDDVNATANTNLTIDPSNLFANDAPNQARALNESTLISVDGSNSLGSVSIIEGEIIYSPAGQFDSLGEDEVATDSFTYTISDADGVTSTATVNVTVTGVNDAPIATPNLVTTNEDNAIAIDVLSNDSDVDSDALTIGEFTNGANGTVSTGPAGNLIYTPNANFNGIDSFTYTVTDGELTSTATVTVLVNPINDVPQINITTLQFSENDPVLTISPDSLGIFDVDGDSDLSVFFFGVVTPSSRFGDFSDVFSVFSQNPDGTVTITVDDGLQNLNAGETDSFAFNVAFNDGTVTSAVQTVTIEVVGENDEPIAVDDTFQFLEEGLQFGTSLLLMNDTDFDAGAVLSVTGVSIGDSNFGLMEIFNVVSTGGRTAALAVGVDGLVTFDPLENFEDLAIGESDTLEFTYTISDGNGGTSTATATLIIQGLNDQPVVASAQSFSVSEGETTLFTFEVEDADTTDEQTISIPEGFLQNIIIQNPDGTTTFDPGDVFEFLTDGESFTIGVTVTASDDSEVFNDTSVPTTVEFTITGVDDPVDAVDDEFEVEENGSFNLFLIENDIVIDDGQLTVEVNGVGLDQTVDIVSEGGRTGSFTVTASGVIFNPGTAFDDLGEGLSDTITFDYTLSHDNGTSDTATATITVKGKNDAPTTANIEGEIVSENEISNDGQNTIILLDESISSTEAGDLLIFRVVETFSDPIVLNAADVFASDVEISQLGLGIEVVNIDAFTSQLGRPVDPNTVVNNTFFDVNNGTITFELGDQFVDLFEGQDDVFEFDLRITDFNDSVIVPVRTVVIGEFTDPIVQGETFTLNEDEILAGGLGGNLFANDTRLEEVLGSISIINGDNIIDTSNSPKGGAIPTGQSFGVITEGNRFIPLAFDDETGDLFFLPANVLNSIAAGETDSFTINTEFGVDGPQTATTFVINGQNDAPQLGDIVFVADVSDGDATITIDVDDVDGDSLIFSDQQELFNPDANPGTIVNDDGTITVLQSLADGTRARTDTIMFFNVSDGSPNGFDSAEIRIIVTDGASVFNDNALAVNEFSQPITIFDAAAAPDAMISVISGPSRGTLIQGTDGSLTFDLNSSTTANDNFRNAFTFLDDNESETVEIVTEVTLAGETQTTTTAITVNGFTDIPSLQVGNFMSSSDNQSIFTSMPAQVFEPSLPFLGVQDFNLNIQPAVLFSLVPPGLQTAFNFASTFNTVVGDTILPSSFNDIAGLSQTENLFIGPIGDAIVNAGSALVDGVVDTANTVNDAIEDVTGIDVIETAGDVVQTVASVAAEGLALLGLDALPNINFGGSVSGTLGLQPTLTLTTGDIDTDLAGAITFITPAQVNEGEEVTLQSLFSLDTGVNPFTTMSPGINFALNLVADLTINAFIDVLGIAQFDLIDAASLLSGAIDGVDQFITDDGLRFMTDLEIFSFGNNDIQIEVDLPMDVGSVFLQVPDFSTEAGMLMESTNPGELFTASSTSSDPDSTISLGGPGFSVSINEEERNPGTFLDVNIDLDAIASAVIPQLPPLSFSGEVDLPLGFEAGFELDLLDIDLNGALTIAQDFLLTLNTIGAQIVLETGERIDFTPGEEVTFTVPEGFDVNENGILDFTTEFTFNGMTTDQIEMGAFLESTTNLDANVGLDLSLLAANFSITDPLDNTASIDLQAASLEVPIIDATLATLFEDEFALGGFETEMLDFQLNVSQENPMMDMLFV